MDIVVVDDYAALSRAGADILVAAIAAKPDLALVIATGDTPMGLYRELAAQRAAGAVDTSRLRVFQLDAYLDIGPDDPRSLYGWMHRSFLEPLGIDPRNVVRLAGDAPDAEATCHAYDAAVDAAGGFDIAVLGLGPNGHLGFNEPPTDANAPTRVVPLTEESMASNAHYWGGRDRVPRRAITAGMKQLLAARSTLLVVSGVHKRDILRATLESPPRAEVPSSWLQTTANVTILADRAALPNVQ